MVAEVVYVLLSLLLVFRVRGKFSNVLALSLLNGISTRKAFKMLMLPFLVVGIIPLVMYLGSYYLFEFYWYPLYTAYPLILGLVGVVFSSLLIDYYTVSSAYSDQQKFLKVRSIE